MDMPETALLAKLLDVANLRQQTISGNIANANTPGYCRREVKFEDRLRQALASNRMDEVSALPVEATEDATPGTRTDGNNVDLGSEINALMQNGVSHQLLTRALSTKMRIYH